MRMMKKCPKCKGMMVQVYPRDYACQKCGYEEYYDFNEHKLKKVL